jgi:hypothetical protein
LKTNHRVKYIRCDDVGENRKAAELYIKEGLNVQFEFTPPGMPQRNSRIERKFATCYGRMRACYEAAKIKDPKIKYRTWAECTSTIVKLDNNMTGGNRKEPAYKRFYGNDPPFASSLRTFGELGVVAIYENKDKRRKLKERGKICMSVGYPDVTIRDSYRMLNLKTNRVIKSKRILWMKKNYGEWMEPENGLGSNMKRVDEFMGMIGTYWEAC